MLKIAKDLFDLLYPVGTYYETSNANWTPSSAGWYGIWGHISNKNALPSGVTLIGSPNYLKSVGLSNRYGGTTFKYFYKVTSTSTSDNFYLNPRFESYPGGSNFYPGDGGVGYGANVKVFAKGGTRYMWRRTA